MKNYKFLSFMLLMLIVGVTYSCKKNDYIKDGGKAKVDYDGTILDYLKSRPDYFKKLVQVIDYAGMQDVFQKEEVTFFAPTDLSINKSMNALNDYRYNFQGKDSVTSITQVKPEVWREMLNLYLIKDKYVAKDIPQLDTVLMSSYPGQAYISYGGKPMNIGLVYNDANGIKYAGYRQLVYSYVNDFVDMDMKNAYIATSDIQPTNGAVHVVRFTDHDFGFDRRTFIEKAIAAGVSDRSAK